MLGLPRRETRANRDRDWACWSCCAAPLLTCSPVHRNSGVGVANRKQVRGRQVGLALSLQPPRVYARDRLPCLIPCEITIIMFPGCYRRYCPGINVATMDQCTCGSLANFTTIDMPMLR